MNETEGGLRKEIPVTVEKWDGYYVATFSLGSWHQMSGVTDGRTFDELLANIQEAVSLSLSEENPADFGLVEIPAVALSFRMELDHTPIYTNLEWTGMHYTD